MPHTLTRYEKYKDARGRIVSIAIAVEVEDAGVTRIQERFLTAIEVAAVLVSESALRPIVLRMAAAAVVRLRSEQANKPQPTDMATVEKLDTLSAWLTPAAVNAEIARI